jgi:hypothetical protein
MHPVAESLDRSVLVAPHPAFMLLSIRPPRRRPSVFRRPHLPVWLDRPAGTRGVRLGEEPTYFVLGWCVVAPFTREGSQGSIGQR